MATTRLGKVQMKKYFPENSTFVPTVLATGGIGAALAEKDKMGGAAL